MTINLTLPDITELKPRLMVFGVGGAGGNAVNNMISAGLQGVEFVVGNTDSQALTSSRAPRVVQMGVAVTEGLGAGSHPEVGRAAAEETIDEIRDHMSGAHMVFVTAGMGGGTGTGAAPVVAKAAKEMGILTVGVVTKPFHFEGVKRMRTADAGILELQKHVDTLLIIPNQNLFRVANEKTTFADAFAMADQVLYSGVACITDLMVKEGLINLDFADVRAVMREMGKAMMGTGEASGENRALRAAEAAISNPLLDDVEMKGAKGLLISITGGRDMTLYELDEAATRIREEVDQEANIIVGATYDDSLEGIIRVSVVATGIDAAAAKAGNAAPAGKTVEAAARLAVPPVATRPASAPVSVPAAVPASATPAPSLIDPEVLIRAITPPSLPTLFPESPPVAIEAPSPANFIPPLPEKTSTGLRMPRMEDLPPQAQRQMQASRGQAPAQPPELEERRASLRDRLASFGLGRRREDAGADPHEPSFHMPRPTHDASPRPHSAPAQRPRFEADPLARVAGQDDYLEIPAFLRRST